MNSPDGRTDEARTGEATGGLPLPDEAPGTMPAEARRGQGALQPPDVPAAAEAPEVAAGTADDDRAAYAGDAAETEPAADVAALGAGEVPGGTAPSVPAALGTSETLPPVDHVHTPDVGAGGRDIDTAARPLPGRTDHARP